MEGISEALYKKTDKLYKLICRLELVNPNETFILLKNYFSIPKLQYILRTSPTFFCQDDLLRFDECVIDGLQAILIVDLKDGV